MKATHTSIFFQPLQALLFVLLAGSVASTGPVFGQPTPLPATSSIPAVLQTVAASLETGDLDRAETLLQTARTEASREKDKAGKARVLEAQRQIRRFYDPLFENLYWANDQRQKGAWRNAQFEMNEALSRIEGHREDGMPEFDALDRKLEQRVRQEHEMVSQQRQRLYLERLRQGEQLVWNRQYQEAIPALQEAAALLIPDQEQAELNRINELIQQANFRQFMTQGEEAEQREDFPGALGFYLQAQEVLDNAEVQEKIRQVKDRLHFTLLQEAQNGFLAGRYPEAAAKLDEAATHRASDYLDRLRSNCFEQLRERGDSAFAARQYDRALEAFQQARLFQDNDAIRASINRARNVQAYQAEIARADDYIKEGNLPAARRRLKRAARYDNTEDVRQRLTKLDTYASRLKQGKDTLKVDASAAYRLFAEAYQLFPTIEAKEWIARAEAAGGRGEPVGERDFFKM